MKRYLVLASALCLFLMSNSSQAQETAGKCGNEILQTQINNDPALKAKFEQYRSDVENRSKAYSELATANKGTASTVYIPLVFHIILTQAEIDQLGGTQAIYRRVQSQIKVLNEDYNNGNADLSNVPSAFQSVIGKADMYFGLAHTDPNGNGTIGVEIKVAPDGFTGFGVGDSKAKRSHSGGLDPWDNTKYLNVWVVNLQSPQGQNGTVLGYGYSPAYASAVSSRYDAGVVIMYGTLGSRLDGFGWYFYGDQGSLSKGNVDRGRTLTHELGHYFNLFHTWGNTAVGAGNCNDDDGIGDTPRQEDATFSTCPSGVVPNCTNDPHPGGEMYMNFMDYSGDRCTHMFTIQQVARMRAEVDPGGDSHSLTYSNVMTYPTSVSNIGGTDQISLVPNPTTGNFNISVLQGSDKLNRINIISATGQVVKQMIPVEQKDIYNVDLSGMPKGIYMIQLGFDNRTIVRKVVLQ